MPPEAQQQNITLVRKPRGADGYFPPSRTHPDEDLEMRWDVRIQAWEIVTRTGRVEFRIGRVVNDRVLVTFYVDDSQPAEDDLSIRVAQWIDHLRRSGEDLGEWVGPVESEDVDTDIPEDHAATVPREEFDRAARLLKWMGTYIGSMAPGVSPDCYADLNAHLVFVERLDREGMKK